jgi:hypothetical protein
MNEGACQRASGASIGGSSLTSTPPPKGTPRVRFATGFMSTGFMSTAFASTGSAQGTTDGLVVSVSALRVVGLLLVLVLVVLLITGAGPPV